MTWVDLASAFSFGSQLTSTQMQNLRDNIAALAAGDSGAPEIITVALKTTQGTVSKSNSSSGHITIAGGQYAFWPESWKSGSGNFTAQVASASANTGVAAQIFLSMSGTGTCNARHRYIQASPPYDLGDGEISLFIFAVLNGGAIESIYVAPDPPWANNGPTDIRVTRRQGSKNYLTRIIPAVKPSNIDNPTQAEIELYFEALINPQYEEIEITQAVKQADMPIIPHPFQNNDLAGKTIILIDPVSPIMEKLLTIHEGENEIIGELFINDYLQIDNIELSRVTPPGVSAFEPKWRTS